MVAEMIPLVGELDSAASASWCYEQARRGSQECRGAQKEAGSATLMHNMHLPSETECNVRICAFR